jgi:outer membrane protein assembly factor BamB
MMPRRRLLAGGGVAVAGVVGGLHTLDLPVRTVATTDIEWPMARFDAAGTGANPEASGPKENPQIRWECEPETGVLGSAPPILVGDTLFTAGRGAVVGVDGDTGTVRFERSGYSYLSSLTRAKADAYRSDTLAVTGREGIHGLNAGGGYAVAGRSIGLERWHAPGQEPAIRTIANPTEPSPVASEGTVYAVVPETNRVVALDANSGRVRWEHAVGKQGSSHPKRPAVHDGTVFVTSWPNHVVALDARTGEAHWHIELEPQEPEHPNGYRDVNPPTATSEGVVVPSRRAVSLLDPEDGQLRWEYDHSGAANDGSVAVVDSIIFVADGEEALHAIDLDTGEELWTAEYAHDISPVVADGVVYLGYFWLPELVAIDAETGDRRWTQDVPHGPSQPIIGDGILYVVGHGRVIAFEEPEQ